MNLASALIKRVLELQDYDTWARVRRHYLPSEYHQLYDTIEKHTVSYHKLPTLGELKLAIRDSSTLDKVYALESIETDAEPFFLLEYIKNEAAQKEALFALDRYVENSISFESAEEVVRSLQQISLDIEKKIEIRPEEESMQKISLFETEDEMAARIVLGLNADFDRDYQFLSTDLILMGGRRGSGKSITCSNICRNVVNKGKLALYFSTEMPARQILQRDATIATQIPFGKIKNRSLSVTEWEQLARWWASRYIDGEEVFHEYMKSHDFDKFHAIVSQQDLKEAHVDIIYSSEMTIPRIRAEVDKRLALGLEIGVIAVDYVNKVKRSINSSGRFDWTEQIEVSTDLKQLALDTGVPVFSPYQTDASGEARFAKGILDAADAALILDGHKHSDSIFSATATKMRNADDEVMFHSVMNWSTLTIGPESADLPEEVEEDSPKKKKGGSGFGTKKVNPEVYDDVSPPF